jgi:hypothetical protein
MQSSSKSPAPTKVVISGGGPAAFAIAREALNSGMSVVMISDRPMKFLRYQGVSVNPENRRYLLDMLRDKHGEFREFKFPNDKKDIKFLIELISIRGGGLSIRAIERFLKRRVDELKKDITYIEESQIKDIDTKLGTIKVESVKEKSKEQLKEQEFKFEYLVCADGSNNHAVKVLNEKRKEPLITHTTPLARPSHPHHIGAFVTIGRTDGEKLELPETQVVANSRGYTFILAPNIFSNPYNVTCSFSGEAPRDICASIKHRNLHLNDSSAKEDEEYVMKFLQRTIQPVLQNLNLNNGVDLKVKLVESKKKHHDAKEDKLKLQAFKVEPYLANHAAIKIDGKTVMLSGDVVTLGSNYQFGTGINFAFDHARRAGEVFRERKTVDQYDQECKAVSSSSEFLTKLTNFRCFRPILAWGIERTIFKNRREFLEKSGLLVNQLRKQPAIHEAEAKQQQRFTPAFFQSHAKTSTLPHAHKQPLSKTLEEGTRESAPHFY